MFISPIKINNPFININPSRNHSNFLKSYPNDSVSFSGKINNDAPRKIIILIGAPNSGKGTMARALSEHFSLPYISGGDIIRNKTKKSKNFNNIAKKFAENLGTEPKYTQLIKYFICDSIKEKLKLPEYKKGVIIEGFPRSLEEAKMLKNILDSENGIELKIVHLDVKTPILYKRSASRLICKDCNKSYSIENIKDLHKCECGGDLIKREDDTREILSRRLKKYETETLPLLDYYGDKIIKIPVTDENITSKETFEKIISTFSE